MADLANVKVLVQGRVQGVYYRAFAARAAKSLSVTGWVRNTTDGNVEAELEGERSALIELLKQLKNGPPGAIVRKLEDNWNDYSGQYKTFDVRY